MRSCGVLLFTMMFPDSDHNHGVWLKAGVRRPEASRGWCQLTSDGPMSPSQSRSFPPARVSAVLFITVQCHTLQYTVQYMETWMVIERMLWNGEFHNIEKLQYLK